MAANIRIDISKCYGIDHTHYCDLTKEGKLFWWLARGAGLTPMSANEQAGTTEGTRFLRWIREKHGHFVISKHRNSTDTGTYYVYAFEPEYAAAIRQACNL